MGKKRSQSGSSTPHKRQKSSGTLDAFVGLAKKPQAEVIDLLSDESDEDVKPVAGPSKPKIKTEVKDEPIELDATHTPPSRKGKEKAIVSPFQSTTTAIAAEYPSLETDILAFVPARDIDASTWPRNKDGSISMPYAFLTAAFVLISGTKSRLKIVTVLCNVYRTIIAYEPSALLDALYLITNHIGPSYEGIELGLGGSSIHKAVKDVTGVSDRELKRLWDIHGDMGDVGYYAKSNVRTLFQAAPLTITGVYGSLKRIAGLKGGQGISAQKQAICTKMLVAARGEEVRFLLRTFVSHLRIGAVRLTNTAALARAFCLTRADDLPEDAERTDSYWIGDRDGLLAIDKKAKDEPRRQAALSILARAEAVVRRVFVQHPNYSHIVPALLSGGLENLAANVPLAIGTPLNPMLGQITRDLTEIPTRIGETSEFAAEWKYDGQRVQLHARRRKEGEPAKLDERLPGSKACGGKWIGENNSVYCRLFSRHLEDMTDKYPDILSLVPELLNDQVDSLILDAEICAIEPSTGNLLTFQTLANRARKDVQLGAVSVRVCVFAFDLIYLNGEPIIEKSFRERRSLLKELLPPLSPADPSTARFDHVNSIIATPADLEQVREFMEEAIKSKCEGLMVKILDDQVLEAGSGAAVEGLDEEEEEQQLMKTPKKGKGKATSRRKALLSSYEPDKRKDSWLKVKKDYGDVGDSLDLVPVAAWHGLGRKAGWWSPILLALYDPETGSYQAVCKCISGFTDQMYKDLSFNRYVKGSETCGPRPFVDLDTGGLRPDVYWKPSEVWQIRGADITLSPVYPAAKGLVPGARGCSLRFPRFDKLREDKSVEQATTPQQFADAWHRQESGGTKSATRSGPTPAPKTEANGSEEGEEDDEDEEEVFDVMDDF